MNDRDDDDRRRDQDDDDEDHPRSAAKAYQRRRNAPRTKSVSVLGLIALVIGVIGLALSFVPCLGLFTLPLPILGAVLALIAILISAVGQRDGLGIPVSGFAINAVACVVPIALVMGFCGLGMHGAQQAAQLAREREQAAQEQRDRDDAERRRTEVASLAAVVLGSGPAGPLAGASVLGDVLDAQGVMDGTILRVDLDQLVWDFGFRPTQAKRKYVDQEVRIQGTVERKGDEDGQPMLVLHGAGTGTNKIECVFDDPDFGGPDLTAATRGKRITVEGTCEGRKGAGGIVWLSKCRLVK
jgi:hypothetical protein